MTGLSIIGALMVAAGVVWMAVAAIQGGRMSDPHHNPEDTAEHTLEPRRSGLRYLGVGRNWPGLALALAGGALLLLPLVL